MLEGKEVDIGVVKLSYVEGPPSGPPLLMLHGIPSRWQEFLPIIFPLTLRWHVFALDFRGHGNSARVPGEYHSKYYGKDVELFLEKKIGEAAVLFGMSAGGLVALDVAAQASERVKALMIGDSPIGDVSIVL